MSNQPHDPYAPHDPYDPNRPHEPYPQQQPYGQHDPYAAPQDPGAWPAQAQPEQQQQQPYYPAHQDGYQEQPTQTWAGPTWDTRTWQTIAAPQDGGQPGPLPPEQPQPQAQGQPQYGAYGTGAGQYQEAPVGQAAWHGDQSSATHAPAGYAPMDGGRDVPMPQPQQAQQAQQAQQPRQTQTAEPVQEPQAPMTAAEKARAEGRPQILAPGLQPAAITAVLAVLLAVAAPLPQAVLAVPVVLLQAVTAAGWFRLNGMWPARQGIALAFLAGLVADIGLLATDADQAP
ncbi:hypothetical protein ACFU99_20850, partial [Streptomyces sp. NPDC057654]